MPSFPSARPGGSGSVNPEDTLPDGGVFDIGSGSVHDLDQGKYYVVGWDGTQDMPPIPPEIGVLTKIDNFDGTNGSRIVFSTETEKLYLKTKLAGGWEDWAFYSNSTPLAGLANNEMVKWDSAVSTLAGTGDINTATELNIGQKAIVAKEGRFDSGTIDMVGYRQKELGGYLKTESSVTGRSFLSMDYEIDSNGTIAPTYDSRGALRTRDVIQGIDTTQMLAITGYSIIPDTSQDVTRIYLKFINPVTNFRAKITSQATGRDVSFVPSRSDFDSGVGLSLGAGEQFFELETALAEVNGFQVDVELFADQDIDVLGDGTNPWRAIDRQIINPIDVMTAESTARESISTAWISGGVITQNTATTIDIAAGTGRIVSIDAQGVPDIINVSWDEQLNVALPDIATDLATRVGIDQNGVFIALGVEISPSSLRNNIVIGSVSHPEGTISAVVQNGLKSQEIYAQLMDNLRTLGVTKRGQGFALTPNADLTFQKAAGELESVGAGIATGNAGQNISTIAGEAVTTFDRVLGVTDDIETSATTLVDPGFYDSGTGTKVAVPVATNATIQYIYQGISGSVVVMYGQTIYTDVNEAVLNNGVDVVTVPEVIRLESNLIGRVIVQADTTDLSDTSRVLFLSGVKFGSGLDGGLSGSSGGGGDYIGAASSTPDEVHTFADASGKVGKAGSDVTAVSGVIKRITPAGNIELQANNGFAKVKVTPNEVEMTAKNGSDDSTTTWRVSDSNGNGFGGAAANLDTGNSVGLKTSQGGTFRSQMYYVANEDATHFSHNGTNSNPNADIVMDNTEITTNFSGSKAMSVDSDGHMDVNGVSPEINLLRNGTPEYQWSDTAGTMKLGVTGYASTNSYLEMEFGFTSLRGGSAGWSRLVSGNAIVSADGTSENVIVNDSTFPQGDAITYPDADGLAGDRVTTDGAGTLSITPDNFEIVTTSTTLGYDNKEIYIDSSAGDMTLTLGDNPRNGERKLMWMGNNANVVELVSANPTYPIDPQTPPAEANIEGMWTLNSDFNDRFSTDNDMSNSGTGGTFVPVTVNGNAVNGFDFQNTAYLEAVPSGYVGILGGSARSMTCWYQANNGQPTTDQNILSFGEDVADGGGSYWEVELRGTQGWMWVNNRNAWRRFLFTDLAALNLFDGNMHHIAVTQNTSNMGSVALYIDGVQVTHSAQDTFPNCNTKTGSLFKIGAGYGGNNRLDGVLYDVRLFNRGLTLQEVDEIRNENILGGVTLSALNNDMVIDVTFNGASWVLGVGTESLVGSIDGRLTDLEASALRGVGTSTANSIVTYADDTGLQADNDSGVTVIDGLFVKDGITPNMRFQTPTGGDITLETTLTNIVLNETTGNIEMLDGGDGEHNLFFGRHRMRNPSDSPGIFLEDSTGGELARMLWDSTGSYMGLHHGSFSGTNNEIQVRELQTRILRPTIVNSLESIESQAFQVNEQFSDAGDGAVDYSAIPARVNLLTSNGGNTPSAPLPVMSLHRSGVPAASYGNSAYFNIGRYENSGTNMRTSLDIRLGHNQPTGSGEGGDAPIILVMQSGGQVEMPTKTAAFIPPQVTTAQMNNIDPVGIVQNTEEGLLYQGDGTSWNSVGGGKPRTVDLIIQRIASVNVSTGFDQPITSGAASLYEVDGVAETANISNGVWTVDVTGTYMLSVEGWLDRVDIGHDLDRVLVTIAKNNQAYTATQPGYSQNLIIGNGSNNESINASGIMKLSAGDNIRIKTRNIGSTTDFDLNDYTWRATLIHEWEAP